MDTKKKEYAAVDLFKLLCAVMVMAIHTKPFESVFWLDAAVGLATRFAVPFFFTISAYLLFQKIRGGRRDQRWQIIGKYLLRLLRFYLIWFVITRVFDALISGSFNSPTRYLRQFLFTTDGSPLWFLCALLWATLLVSVLTSFLNKKIVFVIGTLFLLIGYCFSTLLGVTGECGIITALQPIVGYTNVQGPFFFAFPYVAMGALLAEKTVEPHITRDALLTLLFFGLLGVESVIAVTKLAAPLTFLWLSALPMTWFVVRLTLTIELKSRPVYYTVRKLSTLCYVLHILVFKSLQLLFTVTGVSGIDTNHLILFGLTVLFTLSLAYGILCLSRKKGFHWLKYVM